MTEKPKKLAVVVDALYFKPLMEGVVGVIARLISSLSFQYKV